MSMSKRFKHRNKAVVAGLATAAALAGGVGVAAAGGPPAPPNSGAASDQAEQPEGAEGSEGTEGAEEQEPSLNGSVAATEVEGETEQQEATRLASDATVSQAAAEAAALQAVPGTVTASELGNENGSVVWEVDVQKADGSAVEVKVDAGNGTVLAQETGDEGDEGTSDNGEHEDGEQDEAGEATTG